MNTIARLVIIGVLLLNLVPVHSLAAAPASPAPAEATPTDLESAGDWPMYQHDASHSGRASATVVNTGPLYVQWAYSFGERVEVEVQPVIADGVAYIGAMNGNLHAINLITGQDQWLPKRPGGPIAHTAAVADGRIIFGSLDGKVYALSKISGSTLWQYQTGGAVVSAPTVVNGIVYIGSNDGNLYALNAADGSKRWNIQTGAPVVSSPAVSNGQVYFGSEDLMARAANADTGALIWSAKLNGAGMRNTHPVVSDDGKVVIFVTVKAGVTSYVPVEDYPDAAASANPVDTWNSYYSVHPTYRTLYYLNTTNGADLWDKTNKKYVPLPIPYWGLIEPVLHPDGSAWFPAAAGTVDHNYGLDHDDRLLRIDLTTGLTTQQAGGGAAEFQKRTDEVGRAIFSGSDYYYTISEDVAVYRPTNSSLAAIFSNGDATGYNFGSHMDPHSPLPSRHLWRYGGAVTMGGVPGASTPVVVNNRLYFISYGWLYALGPTDQGKNAATDFTSYDRRRYELTYPRQSLHTLTSLRTEVDQRVADMIAAGPDNPPITARWDQADSDGNGMLENEFRLEVYGYEADLVRVLAEAYPYLSSERQTQLKTYLAQLVDRTLLTARYYTNSVVQCLVFGETGVQEGAANCQQPEEVTDIWSSRNPNLVGMRLYAVWAYANATGDWTRIQNNWSMLWGVFNTTYLDAAYCKPSPMGFCVYESWRVGRLNIGAQIEAAQAMRDIAAQFGKTSEQTQAQQFLDRALDARVQMNQFVSDLYTSGKRKPAFIRLNKEMPNCDPCDARIYHKDIIGVSSPYNNELVPYHAELRNASTDPSQLNWWYSDAAFQVDSGVGFMTYQALSGDYPLSTSLINLLHDQLYAQTLNAVNSYEVNMPWWWLTDLAHHTTGSGEHLYTSPTLSWTMFQVKAWVLKESWGALARQLPEPISFYSKYDLFRLQNVVTLLALAPTDSPDFSASAFSALPQNARFGQTIHFQVDLNNVGSSSAAQLDTTLASELTYVPGSLQATCGVVDASHAPQLQWSGNLETGAECTMTYDAQVTTTTMGVITNNASILVSGAVKLTLDSTFYLNPFTCFIPSIYR